MKLSSTGYYIRSAIKILINFNWWVFPQLMFKKPVFVKIRNNSGFYVNNLMEIWTLMEVVVDQEYEIYRKLLDSDTVIDVGAAVGEFSIYASRKAEKVVAIECRDSAVELLRKNAEINETNNLVIIHQVVRSLNEVMSTVEKCDFLKVDCEGCEYEIFKNADQSTLDKIGYIAMEVHFFDEQMRINYYDLVNILKESNFAIRELENPVHDYLLFIFASKI